MDIEFGVACLLSRAIIYSGNWKFCYSSVRPSMCALLRPPSSRLFAVMVLADLGKKLNNALSALNKAPVVDEKVYSGHVRLTSS